MEDLYKALALLGGGFFFCTLIALGIHILRTPDDVWKKAQQDLLARRKLARDIMRFFEGKQ